jgi:hypothetical protein
MDKDLDKWKKKEDMDPIMMDEDQKNKIIGKFGKMHNDRPYQYKMYKKNRTIVDKQGLMSDEEEVEDLRVVENIEEILQEMYERKKKGPWSGTKGKNTVHIIVSVEPTIPCATNTPERTLSFRQPIFSRRGAVGQGSNKGLIKRGKILGINNQLSTPHGSSSST